MRKSHLRMEDGDRLLSSENLILKFQEKQMKLSIRQKN